MPTSTEPHFWNALKERLVALGHVEGRDIVFESRSAEGRFGRLPALAAKAAATTIPIVIATADADAMVKSGVVSSLSHLGGNVTGVSNIATETAPKVFELVRSTLPQLTRVAVLWNPANPVSRGVSATRDAAAQTGLAVLELGARVPADIDAAFA